MKKNLSFWEITFGTSFTYQISRFFSKKSGRAPKHPLNFLNHIMAGLLNDVHILDYGFCRIAIVQQIIPGKLIFYSEEVRYNIGN